MIRWRRFPLLAALLLSSGLTGCSAMPHFMQPHQLQKMNRGVNGTPASGYDSVQREPVDSLPGGHFASIDDRPAKVAAALETR